MTNMKPAHLALHAIAIGCVYSASVSEVIIIIVPPQPALIVEHNLHVLCILHLTITLSCVCLQPSNGVFLDCQLDFASWPRGKARKFLQTCCGPSLAHADLTGSY